MSHKKYEHYVISRFLHRLNDLEIEIQPQQYIARKEGYALADLYLPQFNIVLEVDEPHHKQTQVLDQLREKDIIGAVDADIYRIPIPSERCNDSIKSVLAVNKTIEDFIEMIRAKKKALKQSKEGFHPWNIGKYRDPQTYLQKGEITLKDNCAFRKTVDALKCFDLNYKGYQRGGANHPHEDNTVIWFPKLYENQGWDNSLNSTEDMIIEKTKLSGKGTSEEWLAREKHVQQHLNQDMDYRIVFAHGKNNLGETLYRFKGRFKLDREASNIENGLLWKRDLTTVKTYPNRE